jgi:hypothetical protein
MKDRILIEGEWYVREATLQETELELIWSETVETSTEDYSWTAVRLKRDSDGFYDPYVEFWDKATGKKEMWDNSAWLIGVLEGYDESQIEEAKESMDNKGVRDFIQFLKKLRENFWI